VSTPSQGSPRLLEVRDLAIGYARPRRPATVVAEGLTMHVERGEFVCLVGPNGAGKATLRRTLSGMQAPLAGSVLLDGRAVYAMRPDELAKRVSVVLTERLHCGAMSVYAMVALGRHPYTGWTGALGREDEKAVRWALEAVDATALAARPTSELSDGEMQKALVARALAQEPDLMVLDEPTAFLDLPRRVELMALLRRLARETDRAFLLSTHDLDLALRSADRIWLLRAGGVMRTGAPEDLVLNGAFASTFEREGIAFDQATGSFSLRSVPLGVASVPDAGPAAEWAARALEREGYAVTREPREAEVRVELVGPEGSGGWRLAVAEGESVHQSVESLVDALRRARRNAPSRRAD